MMFPRSHRGVSIRRVEAAGKALAAHGSLWCNPCLVAALLGTGFAPHGFSVSLLLAVRPCSSPFVPSWLEIRALWCENGETSPPACRLAVGW